MSKRSATTAGGSRYVVGIDLGTTNSAVAYLDTAAAPEDSRIANLALPQVVDAGRVVERELLPSFMYLPARGELPEGSLTLPWGTDESCVVGEFAREHGSKVPRRMVSSAKSWLCHPDVDRRGPILPWQAAEDVDRLSPLEACARYLRHMVAAWDATFGTGKDPHPIHRQEVFLTVPASFDAVARELTMEAARLAGLETVTLLEEPQAAFYSWISDHAEGWRDLIRLEDVILVCDIGGGTTDFCVIKVEETGGNLELKRVAVGDHLLLGGDNLDLALARNLQIQHEAAGKKLDSWQFLALWHACRAGKEKLLSGGGDAAVNVVIPGRGSSVVGGSIRMGLSRELVDRVIVEGFFPLVDPADNPKTTTAVGFKQLGLPYVADPAVTRHLAWFLSRHRGEAADSGSPILNPTRVLFNGGVLAAEVLRSRLVQQLEQWSSSSGVGVLEATAPSMAVARGAAYYGMARRGRGIRIRGGAARAYYIGVESSLPAVPGMEPPIRGLCVVPFGMEEGEETEVPGGELGLVVGEPARFRFFGSSTRKEDRIGTIVDPIDEDLSELAPVETTLQGHGQAGAVRPVKLVSRLSEVGTLELWAQVKGGEDRFKLEYSVRVQGKE